MISTNLPLQLTSFIGREREVAEVTRLLNTTRLLMLTGSGGCGKTRLALQIAAGLRDEFPDGVWLVDLASLSGPSFVPQTVASVFGLHESGETPLANILQNFFHAKNMLLVLDNCEHLIQACAELCNVLLQACPDLKILATSREVLHIAGETSFRVPSLSLPSPQQLPPLEILSQYESLRLFLSRGNAVRSDLQLTAANAQFIAQICQRLDGMPLAIELAAARVNSLSIEEIAARLDDRFRLLTSGSRTALPRYQTLRASIDWSYDLLSDVERVVLRRLAVFAGGFTLEAVESVCGEQHKDEILDVLSRLVQKSLVVVKLDNQLRYRLLETIRQYVREKLAESADGDAVRDRHLEYFMNFAEAVARKLHGPEQMQWLDRLDTEHDNLRAALEWSLHKGRVDSGLRLAVALKWFWEMRGYWREGLQRVESLLLQPEAASRTLTRANALLVAGEMAGLMGMDESNRKYLEEAIQIAREQGAAGKRLLALGLARLGVTVFANDLNAGESMLEEGIAIARPLGDEWLMGLLLLLKGDLCTGKKDHRAARKAFEESRTRFKSLGDQYLIADSSSQISQVSLREGDFGRARQEFEQILPYFRQAKDRRHVALMLTDLGLIGQAEGRYDLAKKYYVEALEIARDLGGKLDIAACYLNLGYVAVHDGELDYARSLSAESLTLARELNMKALVALSLKGFASIAAAKRQAQRAVQLFAFADTLLEAGDKRYVIAPDEAEHARYLAIARGQLDEADFNAAWQEGKTMTLEQAIEFALAEPDLEPRAKSSPQTMKEKFGGLTPREREVAVLIAQGKSNSEIAETLVVSERTVTTHVSNILSKLNFTSRTQIASWATAKRLT